MSMQRTTRLICLSQRAGNVSFISRRFASSDSSHHHDENQDSVVYPKAGFNTPFYRKFAIITLLATGFAYYAPAEFFPNPSVPIEDAPWLTRVIVYYTPSREESVKRLEQDLIRVEQIANRKLLFRDVQPPLVRRFKDTALFEQMSPDARPVGGVEDLSDLIIKGNNE